VGAREAPAFFSSSTIGSAIPCACDVSDVTTSELGGAAKVSSTIFSGKIFADGTRIAVLLTAAALPPSVDQPFWSRQD
jgi:hypothetical protein